MCRMDGHTEDVALSYDDVLDYEKRRRVSRSYRRKMRKPCGSSEFPSMGKEYFMEKNEGENVYHSGPRCCNRRISRIWNFWRENSVRFHLVSPGLDQGFPGSAR